MENKNSCVAVYNTREEAEQAVKELDHAGFDMTKLSIVGKDEEKEQRVLGYYNMSDRIKFWGKRGALWGGLWGVLFGSAFVCVPVAGVTVAGALVSTLAGGLSTAIFTGGLTAFGAALYSIGIPKNSLINYEIAIKMDKYLLIVHDIKSEVERAADILETTAGTSAETEVAVYST